MAASFSFNEILGLINIFLGFLLALLAVRYMRFYNQLNAWWRRLLLLTFIFILERVVMFLGFDFLAIIINTLFIGYFIYFLSYITTVMGDIDSNEAEVRELRKRLSELRVEEVN
jgi:hypothetical protein